MRDVSAMIIVVLNQVLLLFFRVLIALCERFDISLGDLWVHGPIVLVSIEPLLSSEVIFTLFLIAESIIALPSLWVAQNLISFLELVEAFSCLFIALVFVRVLQKSKFSIGLLDFLGCCFFLKSKDVIENKPLLPVPNSLCTFLFFFITIKDLFFIVI